MENGTVFGDIMQGLYEIEEFQRGNIKLRSNAVTAANDDISVMYGRLTDSDKYIVRGIITRLLSENPK